MLLAIEIVEVRIVTILTLQFRNAGLFENSILIPVGR